MKKIEEFLFLNKIPVKKYQLDNGLRIILTKFGKQPIVAYQTWFNVGSAFEKPGKTGIAHFLEHLMFKGTKKYKEGEFDKILESLGASINASTWIDWTYYKLKILTKYIDKAMDLESSRMDQILISNDGFIAEKEVIKNERELRIENDPDGYLFEQFYLNFFGPDHPYGHPTIGFKEDIENISLDDIYEFYNTYYTPNNAVISITGNFDENYVLNIIGRFYDTKKPSIILDKQFNLVSINKKNLELEYKLEISQPRLILGYKAPVFNTIESIIFDFIYDLLLGTENSYLYRQVVIEKELATVATGYVSKFVLDGIFQIDYVLRDKNFKRDVLQLTYDNINKIINGDFSESLIYGTKNRILTSFYRNIVYLESLANIFGKYEVLNNNLDFVKNYPETIKSITKDDIIKVAKNYLCDPPNLITFAISKEN